MKQSQLLQFYRDEVKRSKKWRQNAGYENEWNRYIDLYKGKHWSGRSENDRLIVNFVFSTINTMAPAVAVNNPKFLVNARKAEQAANAVITEEVLNYMWRAHKYQDEFRLSVNDWLIVGHGWCKVGYKFVKPPEEKKSDEVASDPANGGEEYGIDDREDVDGNVESEMYVYDDRPFLERISPFDMFVDPDARHPKEMCWIAQRVWRPIQDVNVDSRYSRTARTKVSAKSWSRWTSSEGDGDGRSQSDKPDKGPKSYVEVIEFYDIKRGIVATFALDSDGAENESGFLIKPRGMPYAKGHPFEMLRNYEVADHFYPMGDVCQIESLQLELNETRTQMINHRKRYSRKWLYAEDAFDTAGIQALESDADNVMIPVKRDDISLQSVMQPVPAVITPSEFYDQSAMIIADIDRISGVTDYQRGGGQNGIKRTATEAAMIQDSANAKAQDRLSKIEASLARLGERVIGLMQQFMTGEQVARIVTMPGRAWVNYDPAYIQGDFDYEVAAGSTEPMNETFRRQSAMQLVDASMPFLEMGVANPQALFMQILQKGFGIKDVSAFLQQQTPTPVDPATGQPQPVQGGVPPEGAPPGPPQPAAPEGQAPMGPGGAPPGLPQDIPPELLQQMLMNGGGMPPGMPPQGLPPDLLMALMNAVPGGASVGPPQ